MSLQRLDASDSPSIEALAASARREGYVFLDRLLADLTENATLFDGPGAVLLGHFHAQHLVGVGGVMRDPYLLNAAVGRLQRVYVTPECRCTGIATLLVRHLLDHAGDTYTLVRLRVPDIRAARFLRDRRLPAGSST